MEVSVYAESELIGRGLGRPVVQVEIYECYTIDLCQSLTTLLGYPTTGAAAWFFGALRLHSTDTI